MSTSLAIVGTSSGTEVDVNADKAVFTELRSPAFGSRGYYMGAWNTGAIAATLGSGATVLSMRWTDSTRIFVLRRLTVVGIVLSTITTAVRFDLQLSMARGFTASDSAATAITPAASMNMLRTSMGNSLIASTDLRIASTVAVTAGTRTLDTNPLYRLVGFTGTAAGSFIYGSLGGFATLWDRTAIGQYPLVIGNNEGFAVTTSAAGPATGTFVLGFGMEWIETAAF